MKKKFLKSKEAVYYPRGQASHVYVFNENVTMAQDSFESLAEQLCKHFSPGITLSYLDTQKNPWNSMSFKDDNDWDEQQFLLGVFFISQITNATQ